MKQFCCYIIFAILIAICFVACKDVPEGILDEEQMALLMADLHKAEAVAETSGTFEGDSAKRALKQSVYARHGLTTEQAEQSFRWYGYNMEKYVEVYDRTIELLNTELQLAEEKAGSAANATFGESLALEGDSVDVWNGNRMRRFSATMPSDLMAFNLKVDPNWENGDIYTFRTKIIDNQRMASFSIAVDYQDGTHEYMSSNMMGDGWHEVRFVLDSARTARDIYGAFHYAAVDGEVAYVDSVSLIRTRWQPGVTKRIGNVKSLGVKSYRRNKY